MAQITVHQFNRAGMYISATVADESPLQPGVFLMPGGTVTEAPPEDWPEHQWPRWNGSAWELIHRPTERNEPTAVEKLAAFLEANPDVAALVTPSTV